MSWEREIHDTEDKKQRFLSHAFAAEGVGEADPQNAPSDRPLQSALIVGVSYFAGALVPLLPVLFGANNALFSVLTAGSVAIGVSMLLAFLSGMDIKRRIAINLVIIGGAVAITYVIGRVVKDLFGIAL